MLGQSLLSSVLVNRISNYRNILHASNMRKTYSKFPLSYGPLSKCECSLIPISSAFTVLCVFKRNLRWHFLLSCYSQEAYSCVSHFALPYPVSLPTVLLNTSYTANMWWLSRIYFERALLWWCCSVFGMDYIYFWTAPYIEVTFLNNLTCLHILLHPE